MPFTLDWHWNTVKQLRAVISSFRRCKFPEKWFYLHFSPCVCTFTSYAEYSFNHELIVDVFDDRMKVRLP